MNRILSIQFMRGFAALLVLVEHLRIESELAPYGSVGVDLFFIISGFIIFRVTEKDGRYFLIKRVIRIVPLYWLATLAVATLVVIRPELFHNSEFNIPHLIGSLLFIPHWSEVQGLRPILALGWTLNYEMMFYLLFFLAMRIRHQYRFEISAALLISLWLASNLFSIPKMGFNFYSDAIYLEFIAGMAFAKYAKLNVIQGVWVIPVLIIVVAAFFWISIVKPFDMRIFDHGISGAILFLGFISVESLFQSKFLRQVSVFGGEVSYSLYLTHVYIMGAISRVLNIQGVTLWISCLIVIPLFAWLIFRLIEAPAGSYFRDLLIKPRRKKAAVDVM